jgi:hypothetical protein
MASPTTNCFPARLFIAIETEDPSVIAWDTDGRSFRIIDSKRFRAETIPKHFKRTSACPMSCFVVC